MCGYEIKGKCVIFVKCMYHAQHFQRHKCNGSLTERYAPENLMPYSTMGLYQEDILENGNDEYDEEN